ncbi:hypothetical protein ABIE35_003290 [Paenarthrobacter sp. 4246]
MFYCAVIGTVAVTQLGALTHDGGTRVPIVTEPVVPPS